MRGVLVGRRSGELRGCRRHEGVECGSRIREVLGEGAATDAEGAATRPSICAFHVFEVQPFVTVSQRSPKAMVQRAFEQEEGR
jgi:hypothetical protein